LGEEKRAVGGEEQETTKLGEKTRGEKKGSEKPKRWETEKRKKRSSRMVNGRSQCVGEAPRSSRVEKRKDKIDGLYSNRGGSAGRNKLGEGQNFQKKDGV